MVNRDLQLGWSLVTAAESFQPYLVTNKKNTPRPSTSWRSTWRRRPRRIVWNCQMVACMLKPSLGGGDPCLLVRGSRWWEWVRPKLIHMNHKFFSSVFLVLVFFFFWGGYVVFFCLLNVVNSKDTAASYRHREFIYWYTYPTSQFQQGLRMDLRDLEEYKINEKI